MKKHLFVIMAAVLAGQMAAQPATAPAGYSIAVTVVGAPANTLVWLAMYNDDTMATIDSLPTDAGGRAVFAGAQPLKAGMYKVSLQGDQSPFVDVFITGGEPQHFALSFDRAVGMASLEVHGSPENEFFAGCLHFLNEKQQQMQALNARMEPYREVPDSSAVISAQQQQVGRELQNKWNEVYTAFPRSTLALFLTSVREPTPSEPSIPPLFPNRDSAMQAYYLNYYREHFFDNIDFSDERILRMPFLSNTLRIYYLRILPMDKAVMKERTDFLFGKAKANREVYEYLVRNRYDFFRSAPISDLEDLATELAEQYVINEAEQWSDKAYVARLKEAIQRSKLNPVGTPATNLHLQDSTGKTISIYDVQAPYTVLLFYNPGCHSCAIATPVVWETYQQYRAKGLQVYAAYVDANRDEWAPYIAEKKYDWINVWDSNGTENLYEKYDVHAIPTIYLLDENKLIMHKNLSVEQLQEVLSQLLN
ncbi:MAG: redoxin domain-containing protein [Prevotellaceae bacterium]|jgi:thiol-disulfide isomerase/thioredoxin|nr:redoxin domain-containing protein [Prevotellaceae bacterium]